MGPVEGLSGKPSFVEGMGRWLGWTDAITLSAALRGEAAPAARPSHARAPVAPVERELARVRAGLCRAIEDDRAVAADVDFPPHRRRYLALQQAMEVAIGPLRAQVRAGLAQRSPGMARLAALDAVMDDVIGAREEALLATLPGLLEKRFERLRREHEQAGPAAAADAVSGPTAPCPAWLKVFRQDVQRLLLAELDLRLQPVQGLLEALPATRSP